jgi:hypothetical protein
MAASSKQLFTLLTNKDEYTGSEESSDKDFDSSGSNYSPSDVSSTKSDTVNLFRTIYNRLKFGHRTMPFLAII